MSGFRERSPCHQECPVYDSMRTIVDAYEARQLTIEELDREYRDLASAMKFGSRTLELAQLSRELYSQQRGLDDAVRAFYTDGMDACSGPFTAIREDDDGSGIRESVCRRAVESAGIAITTSPLAKFEY